MRAETELRQIAEWSYFLFTNPSRVTLFSCDNNSGKNEREEEVPAARVSMQPARQRWRAGLPISDFHKNGKSQFMFTRFAFIVLFLLQKSLFWENLSFRRCKKIM